MIAMASLMMLSPKIIINIILSALRLLKILRTATGSVAEISAPNAMQTKRGIYFIIN